MIILQSIFIPRIYESKMTEKIYPSKTKEYVREYNAGIPIELKREYHRKYYATAKGKRAKREKNRTYREKVLLLKLENGL
jgi:hypothetical protein